MIEVYYSSYKNQLEKPIFDNYLNLLPLDIQNKILKYSRWQDAQASLCGKLLLRKRLAELGLDSSLKNLKYTSYGRPYLEDNLDFNISHSGNYVVCAFSKSSRVGIDLEEVKPIPITDFRNQFINQEWDQINNSENILVEFYNLWTAKEATIKAEGKGLSIPLTEIIIKENKAFIKQHTWHLKKIDLFTNYILQVASNQEIHQKISPTEFHF